MSDVITEALLEMHFHKAIVESFKTCFGAKFLKMLKPSPRKEAWVGFDQGWARTTLSTMDLLNELKSTITSDKHSINKFYFGYFMQFKLVKKMTNKSLHSPKGYLTPYYRSEISLKPNKSTKLSQHETLLRLKSIKNTYVCYACPMLFDINEIYEEPDVDKLQIVPIDTAPSGWATGTKHHITFQTPDDTNPLWCSDPVEGKSFKFSSWPFEDSELKFIPYRLTSKELLQLISDSINVIRGTKESPTLFQDEYDLNNATQLLPESFTILEFEDLMTIEGSNSQIELQF